MQLLERSDSLEEREFIRTQTYGYDAEFRRALRGDSSHHGYPPYMTHVEARAQEVQNLASGGFWVAASPEFQDQLLAAPADVTAVRRVVSVVETATGGDVRLRRHGMPQSAGARAGRLREHKPVCRQL